MSPAPGVNRIYSHNLKISCVLNFHIVVCIYIYVYVCVCVYIQTYSIYIYTHLFIVYIQQSLEVCVIRSVFINEKTVTKIDPRSFG